MKIDTVSAFPVGPSTVRSAFVQDTKVNDIVGAGTTNNVTLFTELPELLISLASRCIASHHRPGSSSGRLHGRERSQSVARQFKEPRGSRSQDLAWNSSKGLS